MRRIVLTVFSIVILVLLLQTVIVVAAGGTSTATFSGFLGWISDCPQVKIPFTDFKQAIADLGDWGIFNFARDFVSTIYDIFHIFEGVFNIIIWLFNALLNIVLYVTWFVGYLFASPFI